MHNHTKMIPVTDRVSIQLSSFSFQGRREVHEPVGFANVEVDGQRYELSYGNDGIECVFDGYDGEQRVTLERTTLVLVMELQERLEQWYAAWNIAEYGEDSSFHPVQIAKAAERAAEREAERVARLAGA